MLEGVVIRNTPPLKVIIFIDDGKPIRQKAVFPVKFQLMGFVPLTTAKWGYKEKIGVQNRTSMDTKLLKSH